MKMTEFLPIENYVPHRGAMLLIDRLVSADAEGAVAEVIVPRDGLFLQDAGMPSWVGLEYMAQTVAAWAGWRGSQAGNSVKLGFLLGTRKFSAAVEYFAPGTPLAVHVQCELLSDNGLGMFDCKILSGEQEWATARVSVYEPEDGLAYLRALKTTGSSPNNE